MRRVSLANPWPLFATGLALSLGGYLLSLTQPPNQGRTLVGLFLCVPIFGGMVVMLSSLALQSPGSPAEQLTKWRGGLRSLAAWLLLYFGMQALSGTIPTSTPLLGPVGSPLRWTLAILLAVAPLTVASLLAARCAEALRRAAAWLGRE